MDVALVTNCQHSKQLVCHLQVLQTTLENNFRHFGAPTPKLTVSLSLSKGQLRCSLGYNGAHSILDVRFSRVVLDEMVFTISILSVSSLCQSYVTQLVRQTD